MKKSILALSIIALFTACKKENKKEFTPTDVTGTTVVKGNVSKNVITPNGSGGWLNNSRVPAAGVNVSIKINRNSLYPNSTAQGADVYSGTTDNNGNYAITVKSNATGVNAQITIDGFTGTLDTLINGQVKTGLYATYAGTTQNRTIFMGQNSTLDHSFNASLVTTNPNAIVKIGNATVTGSLGITYIKEILTGTVVSISSTVVPLTNHKVYLQFSNDPHTQAAKSYEVETDANGYYNFNLTTVENGTPGFSQNATIWINDFATTQDTIKADNSKKTGKAGVYQMKTIVENAIYNNHIRNAKHITYTSFTAN